MKKNIFMLAIGFIIFCSCGKTTNKERLTIASETRNCTGVAPMQCMLVKHENQTNWEFFYNTIEGFNYVPGYEYVIEVKKEKIDKPAADQSSLKYTLVKEVSKQQKHSENLPE